MTAHMPFAAKIRFIEGQIDMTQKILVGFDPLKPEKYPGEHQHFHHFRYQEEVLMSMLEDYKMMQKAYAQKEQER